MVDAQSIDYLWLIEATKDQQPQTGSQRGEMAALRARLSALVRQGAAAAPRVSDPGFGSILNSGNLNLAGLLGIGAACVVRRRKAG